MRNNIETKRLTYNQVGLEKKTNLLVILSISSTGCSCSVKILAVAPSCGFKQASVQTLSETPTCARVMDLTDAMWCERETRAIKAAAVITVVVTHHVLSSVLHPSQSVSFSVMLHAQWGEVRVNLQGTRSEVESGWKGVAEDSNRSCRLPTTDF